MKYLIDIYLEEWDYDKQKLKGITNLHSGFYESVLAPRDVENGFYIRMFSDAGDGIKLQSYEYGDFVFLRLVFLWTRDYSPVFEYLNKNFNEAIETLSDFPLFNLNSERYFILEIDDNDNNEHLFDIVKGDNNIKIIRLKEIYEKGATGWDEAFIISVAAGASIEIIQQIAKYIKTRAVEDGFIDPSSEINASELKINNALKTKVADLSNENINNLYLSSFRWRDDKKVEIRFKSRYKLIFLTCDSNLRIEECQIRDLTQTRI